MSGMTPDILSRLVSEQAGALVLYARQWCDAPEDVVQDAFLKLMGQTAISDNVVPWLYRVVRNQALTVSRSNRRRRRHESAAAAKKEPWFEGGEGTGLDGEATTEGLRGLPPEQREVIIAHLWGGLTFEQVAELVGCSASTAHRWYMAGLSSLRERLGQSCRTSRNES